MRIERKDLSFNSKDVLVVGSQRKVYRGVYKNENVAIKVVQLFGINSKLVAKEVLVLQSINGIIFINIIGICTEKKYFYITMELFKSRSLFDVIQGITLFYTEI